jgi:tRNA(Ile)-lysidine synthase
MRGNSAQTVLRAISRVLNRAEVKPDSLIIAALSGGADSVAMVHALIELRAALGYRLAAAHLNHRIRGAESDRDEAFVRALCRKLEIDLVVERAQGLDAAMPNLEEAARETRHAFLRRAAAQTGAKHIALGHHRDDQAETVLARMLRGAGVSGMKAMDEIGAGGIVRPMLSLARDEIRGYLFEIGASSVEDSSNAWATPLRNRIRHDLIPALERDYAPRVSARLAAFAVEMRMLDAYVSREAARALDAMRRGDASLDASRFAELDPALRAPVLRAFIEASIGSLRRIGRAHLEAIERLVLHGPPNGEISLPGRWRAVREYSRLRLTGDPAPAAKRFAVALAFEGTTVVETAAYSFDSVVIGASEASAGNRLFEDKNSAFFDLREIATACLVVRNFAPGDRIRPFGMNGTRKVKDVLIDSKVGRERRARMPMVVVEDRGVSEIVWIPGIMRSDWAPVTSASETVLRIYARELSPN